jgi:hypothetical protein
MRATSADGAFEFRILERHGKIIAQVYSNVSHSFDTTGKVDRNPNWEFASVDEAKEWAKWMALHRSLANVADFALTRDNLRETWHTPEELLAGKFSFTSGCLWEAAGLPENRSGKVAARARQRDASLRMGARWGQVVDASCAGALARQFAGHLDQRVR